MSRWFGGSNFAVIRRVGGCGCGWGCGGVDGWAGQLDSDVYGGHFLVPLFVVSSVDQDFVEDLTESSHDVKIR